MSAFVTRLFAIVIVLSLGVSGNRVHKRSLSTNLKCDESGRFYRNPDRSEDTIWTRTECSKYYLCLEGEVFEFQCTTGLLFDVNRQLCDKPNNVHNCDLTTETRIPQPLLEKASCANETHLGCANGICLPSGFFCDGSTDCTDSSDEAWCDVSYDPNAAMPCNPFYCQLPSCFCSINGTSIPGNLVSIQTPQMITVTFDGAINHENWDMITKTLFTKEKKNPNGCPIKATFFVSHPYTNYRHVQKLWNDGHEIAVNSITNRGPEEWWAKNATIEEWFDEMVGQANIINRFARVRIEDFRGLRVPHLAVGWNRQFLMMQEFGFVYDATVVGPDSHMPMWPYTLDYKIPHTCSRNYQYCPTRSYAGLWEMVINPLINGSTSCARIDHCELTSDESYDLLMTNFKRHYLQNRAPFGIHLSTAWLKNGNNLKAIKQLFTELQQLPDVYFVSYQDVINWIKRPTPVVQLKKFQPWQCKPLALDDLEIACLKPHTCKLPSKVLEHDQYMMTCTECPKTYPWLRNEFGVESS